MNLPVDVLPDWSDFIKEHGTKRFVEYTDESDSRYAELAACLQVKFFLQLCTH